MSLAVAPERSVVVVLRRAVLPVQPHALLHTALSCWQTNKVWSFTTVPTPGCALLSSTDEQTPLL